MTAWPLDNTEYTAEEIGAWSGTRTRGVFSAEGCFAVTAAGGFGVGVSPGLAWLKVADYWGIAVLEKVATAMQLEVGSGLLPRYVAVVLQYDKTDNEARLTLRYGEYSDTPAKPQPVRDEYYDEIILASILQPAAAVEITQADITDERLNEEMCGLMRDGVTGLPTAQLFAQARAQLDGYSSEFELWFARIKGQLSEDAAGHLQQQVDALGAAGDKLAGEVQIFEATLLADGPQVPTTGVQATDAALKEGLDALCEAGNAGETLDGQLKWVCYNSPPTVDLPLRLRRAAVESTPDTGGGEQEPAGPDES